MKKLLCAFGLSVAITGLGGTGALASDYGFRLHNRAAGYTINGFYTYQDGRWSDNWLTGRVRPGQAVDMDWFSNDGNCTVPFRVSWDDYGADDFKLDWCKGVSNLYMKDKGFSWD
ncbi:hypothetical protein [Rhizobium rhizosphaerae]|uniref:hypothetical protein n=1 Tax=Xaviernesmea rhizosphaerae TaxID=1672749 RepID=UPI001594A538|nr:hypothetical protein [Xaviernesmea rhizosphaerae]